MREAVTLGVPCLLCGRYWCSAGGHAPGQTVAWTGLLNSRRVLFGIDVRWSYAPAEVKVLTSADGGNFEEAAGWRKLARPEPSFEESIMFASELSAKAVTILMRVPKPWGYFGISSVAALSGPFSFMLVSGKGGQREQCLVSTSAGVALQPCLDAIVAGAGVEIFGFTGTSQLQRSDGKCLALFGSRLGVEECQSGRGAWEASQDGQLKQGDMCLAAAAGSQVAVADCDDAAAARAEQFFPVAVPSCDPAAAVAVQSVGALLKAAIGRQAKLIAALQGVLPKLDKCRVASLAGVSNQTSAATVLKSGQGRAMFEMQGPAADAVGKIAGHFGAGPDEFARVVASSRDVLAAVSAKLR